LDCQDVSLDLPAFRDSAMPLVERLPSSGNPEQDLLDATFRGSVGAAMQAALGRLDARERYVVEARLMAESGEELSLTELGKVLGVSRERVRQLEVRAKRKLRALVDASGDPVVAEWTTAHA
jgi:RNA polymerase sigma-32 factor